VARVDFKPAELTEFGPHGGKDDARRMKKKTRRVVKVQRDIVGATMEQIRQKRAQKPEIRAASREAALREIKDRKQKKAAGAKKPAVAGKAVKQQQPKNVKKAAASKPATKGR